MVVVFGTGFLGRRLVHRLAADGTPVRVAVRHPNGARSAFRSADLDQITFFRADVRDQTSVAAAIEGADAVINAVSAYVEKGGVTPDEARHHRLKVRCKALRARTRPRQIMNTEANPPPSVLKFVVWP